MNTQTKEREKREALKPIRDRMDEGRRNYYTLKYSPELQKQLRLYLLNKAK